MYFQNISHSPLLQAEDCLYYTREQIQLLDRNRIPKHIAIIPDGNRRWAKKNNLSVMQGHRQGADNLMEIVKAAKALGIKVITFYVFSTENWSRDPIEVRALLWLLESYLIEQRPVMLENGVKLQTIGDCSRFPNSVRRTIQESKDATNHCEDIEMVLALNYGSRDEIRRAVQLILDDIASKGILPVEKVTESLISGYLDTAKWPDPDLLIRTSGEKRFSNFLLWQSSYTELYIDQVLWPDFHPRNLLNAVVEFQKRDRRLGGP